MAISSTFYDLEREVRNKYGEQWHNVLDADHPMVVAMRNTLKPEVFSSKKTFKKPNIRVMKNGKHVDTVRTIKECVAYSGLARDTISRRLRGLVSQKGKKMGVPFCNGGRLNEPIRRIKHDKQTNTRQNSKCSGQLSKECHHE